MIAAASETQLVTVIVAAAALFSVLAILGRAAWTLAKATVSQLEATRSNTDAIANLSQRIVELERSVKRRRLA